MGYKSKKSYKVLFRGVILPGFDKIQVVDNIHNITRVPKATIKRKFFSGKTVVIRHADSEEDASRLQDTFAEAGIETYIEKVPEPELQTSSSKKKLIVAATISIIAITVVILFNTFYTTDDTDITTFDKEKVDKKAKARPTSSVNNLPLTIPEIKSQPEKEPVINSDQFDVLLKISDATELERLNAFLPLFNFSTEHFNSLNISKFKHNISIDKPLYLFKTSKENGLLFSIDTISDKDLVKQLKEQLNTINNKSDNLICSRTSPIYLYHNQQTVLLTSRQHEDIQIDTVSKVLKAFEQTDSLSEKSTDALFKFYYRINNSLPKQKPGKHLILSATGKTFRLQHSNVLKQPNIRLLEHLGIKIDSTSNLSSLPINNLSEFILPIIIQEEPSKYIQKNRPVDTFVKEMIAAIQTNSKAGKIKPYQQKLDMELHPQWQSGPFAITTDNYHFDKHLIIEILAKGQNINNLMEYSHSALITPHAVYNTNKENIIVNDCAYQPPLENSFKNLDGEQEAYINDEFVNYYAASAKNAIRIQPGYQLDDVEEISGEISLNQPQSIINKDIISPSTIQLSHFEHFSVMTKMLDKQTIDYLVIGDKNYFLTIRAYNQAGDILETTELKETALLDHSVIQYKQSFSEPVTSIKIFYTNKLKNQTYPFSFKPEIIVAQSPLILSDNKPVPYDRANTELAQLSGKFKSDNPQWLGQKISEKHLAPFNISLFLHEANAMETSSQEKDAVINIKTGITSLISQNIGAVKLDISQKQQTLFNNFITFTEKEVLIDGDNSNNAMNEPELYLDSNTAFEFTQDHQSDIKGSIHLSLPAAFKNHTSKYLSPGQVIKLGNILVKPVKISKQKVQFQIKGNINDLVQLKLYNTGNQLISEPLEFKQIEKDKALLTLLYYDQIDTIKLILAQESIRKEFPFTFTGKASN